MKEIDWEQRRYEIAKDIYPTIYKEAYDDYNIEEIASFAVRYADTLIEELKKKDKQMKAKELKINDWILAGGEPVQIQDVCEENSTLTVCDDNTLKVEEYRYNELMPIPLTSEILEKNGWKEDEEIWDLSYIFGQLHIEFYSNGKEIEGMVSVTDGSDVCCLRWIKYVHELQHLLWALGMDDDLKI